VENARSGGGDGYGAGERVSEEGGVDVLTNSSPPLSLAKEAKILFGLMECCVARRVSRANGAANENFI